MDSTKKTPWYRSILFISCLLSGLLLAASWVFPSLLHFRHAFLDYLKIMAFPVLLGFLLGGMIDHYIPSEYISKHLSAGRKRTVIYAAGLGFLMSSCNHGILALSMALHKKGASGPAVISFLLASPWANMPMTILIVGFFGWKGMLIIFAALLVSMITGLLFLVLDEKGLIETNRHRVETSDDFSIRADIARRWREHKFTWKGLKRDLNGVLTGVQSLSAMVLGWIMVGILLASLSAAFVPEAVFDRYFGPTLLGLILTVLAAAVFEVCSEGTSPLSFEIYRQTGAFGNSFVFLMGGVVTDYTEIGMLWSNIGKKTALWMVAITLPQVLLIGWILNQMFSA